MLNFTQVEIILHQRLQKSLLMGELLTDILFVKSFTQAYFLTSRNLPEETFYHMMMFQSKSMVS